MFLLERANLSARIGLKPLTGRVDAFLGESKPVARIGVKPLTGRVDVFLGESKPVSQDWGKAVDGSDRRLCWKVQTCQRRMGYSR